jgi:beta-N-acetylhexosaminidase
MIRFLFFTVTFLFLLNAQAKDRSDLQVEQILAKMTLEQKIGQLMMVGFGGREMSSRISRLLTELHIGSVALYSRNIVDTTQLARLVGSIRQVMANQVQPFVAVDQEGGNVVRVRSDVAVLPGAMALGATRDPVLAFLAGQASATDLKLLGVDMNLAPVLDVNRNPANQVINVRAFSDHPSLVARLGVPFIQGQQQAGMVTVAKHFPGHGNTTGDSHFSLPTVNLSWDQLQSSELSPFQGAINTDLDAIMTAHILVPAVDQSETPASLSYHVITELLREKLDFNGIVITDDLEMRAITERMTVGEASIRAILAGADIVMVIWTPSKKMEVYNSLLSAARDGRIPRSRIDQSVGRILRLKAKRGTLGFIKQQTVDPMKVLPNKYHNRLVRTIAQRGVTLVKNQGSIVPLCSDNGVLVASPLKGFLGEMKRLLPSSTIMRLYRVPSHKRRAKELDRILSVADKHQVIVVGVVNAYQAWLVQQLEKKTKIPIVAVSFASPYMLRYFPSVDSYLCTFSYLTSVQRAVARALCGKIAITGRLPVTIARSHRRGQGVVVPRRACTATANR